MNIHFESSAHNFPCGNCGPEIIGDIYRENSYSMDYKNNHLKNS